jgi:hypothetical protein
MSEFNFVNLEGEKLRAVPDVEKIISSLTDTFKNLILEKINGHAFKNNLVERLSEAELQKYVNDSRVDGETQQSQIQQIRSEVLQELRAFVGVELENSPNKESKKFWHSRLKTIEGML